MAWPPWRRSAPLHLVGRVRQVLAGDGQLTLVLASGTELRLGDSGDLRLKLSIAKQILPLAGRRSVRRRQRSRAPVAGYKSQVGG